MFCDRCGKEVGVAAQFCGACGKPVGFPSTTVAVSDGRVGRHLNVLGTLWIIYGVIRLLEALWLLLVGRILVPPFISEVVSHFRVIPGGLSIERIVSSSMACAGIWAALFGVVEIVLAWGLLERQHWARILALVIGFLALLRFPFGTLMGIYTIWVLLPAPSGQEYDRLVRTA